MPALRLKAEELLKRVPERERDEPPPEREALIHELQIHEVELQIQNETLREAHMDLEASHDRYRALFERAPVPYLTLDRDGRITDANVAAGVLFKLGKAELIGTILASYLDTKNGTSLEQHRREVAASAVPCRCELALSSADGTPHEVRLESVRTHQLALEWRTAIVDLTEFQRLGRQLEEAQRLEAMGRLASGIAHDFNNLLMGALGCADMALRSIPADSEARTSLEQLQGLVLRGRSTVSELLAFARPDIGEAPILEIDAVLQQSLPTLRMLLSDHVQVELQLRSGASRVHFDRARLERVLLNLASNARDAMPRGGRFRIESRVISPDRLGAEVRAVVGEVPVVRLSVSDTGSGMDTATRKRAFEPFFTTKPAAQGTGLGLSMVYGMVKQVGGYVELLSRKGVGTELAIYLPRVHAVEVEVARERLPDSKHEERTTVLVVDDDRLVRMTVCHYLTQNGYRVLDAAHADAALDVVRAESIDLLLTDIVLPGMNGPELAAAVHREFPELPVLLISAHGAEMLARGGWIPAGTPVLCKPFTAEELCSELRALNVGPHPRRRA